MTKTGATNVPQPTGWSYDPIKGFKTRRAYKGTGKADLAAVEAGLRAGGWAYDVTQEIDTGTDGVWSITATRGGDKEQPEGGGQDVTTPLSESWELASNLIEKDLLASDSVLITDIWTACAGAPAGQEVVFSEYIRLLKELSEDSKVHPISYYSSVAAVHKVAKLIVAGVTSERVFQPTLRHNKIVTSKYAVKDALTNVGKIIRASTIKTLEQIPETLLFNLPNPNPTNDGISFRSDALGQRLKYGWFKKYPNVTQQAEGEWQLSQEFEWGLWHLDLYSFV